MKYRALTLIFATCFISRLALSESGTDAPLMPNEGITPVAQKTTCESRRERGKKEKSTAVESSKASPSISARAGQQPSGSRQGVPAYTAPASGGN